MNDKVTHSGGGLSKAGHSTGTAGTMAVVLMAVGTGAGCSHGPQAEQAAQKARCFASETQASKEMLRVETDDSHVHGFYGWYPADKDAHWGDYSAVQADSVAEGVLHAHGEGVVADEPLHFQLSEGEARVRTWELTDKAEGHYVVPWSDLHSLPEISCTEMVIPAIATTAKIANAS